MSEMTSPRTEATRPVTEWTIEEYLAVWNGPWDQRPEGYQLFRFTDKALEATIEYGGYGMPGLMHPRQAEPLLRLLDTPERRQRADREAYILANLQGGRHSDCLYRACRELAALIEDGRESDEMYAEGAARRHREAEASMRALTGQQVILYPPEMRTA